MEGSHNRDKAHFFQHSQRNGGSQQDDQLLRRVLSILVKMEFMDLPSSPANHHTPAEEKKALVKRPLSARRHISYFIIRKP
jgi:hypothetical protein